ncbi:MAG TPA: DUF3592 domain-containing protein [Polyangia bacterium]|jgi:hypothetical protein|nr:DUF3592 domain-containing protein [Polyangia bacterium]
MRRQDVIQILVGIAFTLVGSFFVVGFAGALPADLAISLLGSTVEGRVQSSELNLHMKVNKRHPTTIRFEYEIGGRRHVASSSTLDTGIAALALPGSAVPVEVWPSHPDLARVAGTMRSTSGWLGSFTIVFPLAGVGLILAVFFSKRARSLRALKKLPATSIRDAQVGQRVKIVGRLVHGENTLTAPLSGRSCACYCVTVRVESGKNSRQILEEIRSTDFFVEDGSGKALVRLAGRGAQLLIMEDVHRRSGIFKDPTPELEALLARHGESSRGGLGIFNRALKYMEGVLEQGERVAVMGVAHLEPDPDPNAAHGYRESASRLVLVPPGGGDLIVTDEPNACTESTAKAA